MIGAIVSPYKILEKKFLELWKNADRDLSEPKEARARLAALNR